MAQAQKQIPNVWAKAEGQARTGYKWHKKLESDKVEDGRSLEFSQSVPTRWVSGSGRVRKDENWILMEWLRRKGVFVKHQGIKGEVQ